MNEVGPQHPLSYRQDILRPMFAHLRAGDSCALIGPASMGKSRLLQFILRPDVKAHYLTDRAANTLLLQADCQQMGCAAEWGLHELLLTAIIKKGGQQHPKVNERRRDFNELREPVILEQNTLLALRHLELALQLLIEDMKLKVCFLIDEFDAMYQSLPAQALANLRGMRDDFKYDLNYVIFLRNEPHLVRDPADCEGFYELFSRSLHGLGPYNQADAMQMMVQLEERFSRPASSEVKAAIYHLSGGHPGLILALIDLYARQPALPFADLPANLPAYPTLMEECRKLWHGLPPDEQDAMAAGSPPPAGLRQRLELKGLLQAGMPFSPLFAAYTHTVRR